jgi:heme exporter protein A
VFRGERLVLRGVSFSLDGGGALLLTGANGAGKSTLLRAVAGLTPLAAGALFWDGAALRPELVAWLGHQDAVKTALSVAENVPRKALAAVGLEALADLPARFLSAGQRRRLAIARVVASGRPLWLLDEPATGLDAASVARLAGLCADHLAGGGMIIASTHTALDLPGAQVLAL